MSLQKTNPLKSKKYRGAAKNQSCIRCGNGADRNIVALRHYNGIWQELFGKGYGCKCHDYAGADFCGECDALFTEGGFYPGTKYERAAEFLKCCLLTVMRRESQGVIG